MKRINFALTDEEITRCHAVMAELRPHFASSPEKFLQQIRRQEERYDFRLVYLADDEKIKAVAGIRVAEWLAGGKYLEIEDLVAAENERSRGCGGALFDWITDFAKNENCAELRLVSNVTRYGAHKFYLKKGMIIQAHYFSLKL